MIGGGADVAHLAVFLASDESSYITGESIEIDGGLIGSGLAAALHLARTREIPDGR